MKSPEQSPPGTNYRLRFTVLDEIAKDILAELRPPSIRQSMPDSLYVFSQQHYTLVLDDYFDGASDKDLAFRSYQRRVSDYDRATFTPTGNLELRERFIKLGVQLGREAAHRIIAPPFFDQPLEKSDWLPFLYPLRPGTLVDPDAVAMLAERMTERPRNTFGELKVVGAVAVRHVPIRPPEPRDDILSA